MGMTASLSGRRVTSARINLPSWGCWYADASVDGDASLSGAVELIVADLRLQGTVLSGGPSTNGARSIYRIVGGKGGWGRSVPRKSYATDSGVKFSTVIYDAANEVSEVFDATTAPPSMRIGPAFARIAGPASRVLEQLAPSGWYVGEDGITRLGARAATTYKGKATRTHLDAARGTLTLASDSIAALLPGVSVDGLTASDILHELTKDGLRTTLWAKRGANTSRRLAAFRAILDQLDPDRAYRGIYEYRVVTLEGLRLNLQPVRTATGMPNLARVPLHSLAGHTPTLALGSRVLVSFVDADPGRPIVIGFEDLEGEGFAPTKLEVESTGAAEYTVGGLFKINGGSDFVALAQKVDTALDTIKASFNSHVHPTGVGPSGAPAAPIAVLQPTACTKLKTD